MGRVGSVVCIAFVAFGCVPTAHDPVSGLVRAERDFAADAGQRGIPAAFLGVLAEDAVVFTPRPVPARERYVTIPDGPARLEWEPRVAESSAAGDLGYTTGPYTYRPAPDAEPSHGHYLSVWRRPDGGPWRLVVDLGTPHPPVQTEPESFSTARGRTRPAAAETMLTDLLEIDAAPPVAGGGPLERCTAAAAPDFRFLIPGRAPAVGRADACAVRAEVIGDPQTRPDDGEVSRSGDLGFTRGWLAPAGAADPTHVYVRVWRHGPDGWARVAEVVLPLPAADAEDDPDDAG